MKRAIALSSGRAGRPGIPSRLTTRDRGKVRTQGDTPAPILTLIAWEAAKRAYARAPKGRRLAAWRRLQAVVHEDMKAR